LIISGTGKTFVNTGATTTLGLLGGAGVTSFNLTDTNTGAVQVGPTITAIQGGLPFANSATTETLIQSGSGTLQVNQSQVGDVTKTITLVGGVGFNYQSTSALAFTLTAASDTAAINLGISTAAPMTSGGGNAHNLTLGSGSTNTLAASTTQTLTGNFVSSSSCTAFTTISSNSSTVPATISKATGSVALNFASLNNITATGGASFSITNALNSGTNAGWSVTPAVGRNLYWIGGTGNWGDGSHWSLTSGGAAVNCTPIALDNVFFDANSFSAADQIVTVNVKASCVNMNWTGVTNTPKLRVNNNWSDGLNIYGSLTFVDGMTTEFSVPTFFRATATGKTITMAGKRIMWAYFEGVGGGWTLQAPA
jgi:hypothetical protein